MSAIWLARAGRDLVSAARQALTQEWWQETQARYDIHVSVLVLQEAGQGDPEVALRRIDAVAEFPVLDLNNEVERVAEEMIKRGDIPAGSEEDALHIAIATVHGMDYLVTWNFRHINNAELKSRIVKTVESTGYQCPVICSPEELGG